MGRYMGAKEGLCNKADGYGTAETFKMFLE
jgi:hypothetical protein